MEPVQIAKVVIPLTARADGDSLVIPGDGPTRARRPDRSILENFIEIQSAADVEKFVRRYGALGLDSNDEPQVEYREPLSEWFRMVELFRGIRDCAGYLNARQMPPRQSITAVAPKGRWAKQSPEMLKVLIADKISRLLARSGLVPSLQWRAKVNTWSLTLAEFSVMGQALSLGCFGTLVWRLVLEVTGSPGFAFCSLCGAAYPPTRTPSEGRGNYCAECRSNGAMWRHLKQAQRKQARETRNGKKTR